MFVRIGPDDVELTGRTLYITEAMLEFRQPVTYTCIARNQVEMVSQQQQERMYRSAAKTHEVKTNVTFTVGKPITQSFSFCKDSSEFCVY